MSGQSFPQDVVAGTQLVVPSIHSPNFITQVSGWTINLDGSAEFNNLTIRGTFMGTNFVINSSGIFLYSPSEALGNLIGSWASSAGTDSFGNSYPQGLNVTQGTISGTTFSGTNFAINSSGAFFYSGTPAAGNLAASVASSSGTDSFGNQFLSGLTSYSSSWASQLGAGFLFLYHGTQAGGWTQGAIIQTSNTGSIILQQQSGQSVLTDNNTLDNGSGGASFGSDVTVSGVNLNVGNGSNAKINLSPVMAFPSNYPLSTSVPNDTNSGTGWVSGERAFMNNNWVAAINQISSCVNDIVASLHNRGMMG